MAFLTISGITLGSSDFLSKLEDSSGASRFTIGNLSKSRSDVVGANLKSKKVFSVSLDKRLESIGNVSFIGVGALVICFFLIFPVG